jgi:adenosylcobinamide-phosphate synthase
VKAAIALGWLTDRILGDPKRYHPVAGFGRIAGALEARTWRPRRSAGIVHVLLLVLPLARVPRSPASLAVVVWSALGGRSLRRAASDLAAAVSRGELEHARILAPTLVGRDASRLDGAELSRATVESVAENTSDAVVAPLVWAAIAGAPAVAAYRAVNTLDAMIGHKHERYREFGWFAARLDDAANWLPARITALLAIAAAPLVGGAPSAAWRAAWHDGRLHPSPNAGRVEGAFAGALGIRLGGLNRYTHGVEQRPFLGDGRAPAVADIERAITLQNLVELAAVALAVAWRRP